MKFIKYSEGTPHIIATLPTLAPIRLPRMSNGKKIPPAAPDPNETHEINNFNINNKTRVDKTRFGSLRYSTSLCPPPMTSGQ